MSLLAEEFSQAALTWSDLQRIDAVLSAAAIYSLTGNALSLLEAEPTRIL